MKGWVYIITNKAMPGLVKIGYSDRDPENRAIELNSTASPHSHVVEFAVLVDEPKQVEQSIHLKLKQNHEGKEWFRCTIDAAKSAMISDQTNPVITHGTRHRPIPLKQKLPPSTTVRICPVCGENANDLNRSPDKKCGSCRLLRGLVN